MHPYADAEESVENYERRMKMQAEAAKVAGITAGPNAFKTLENIIRAKRQQLVELEQLSEFLRYATLSPQVEQLIIDGIHERYRRF